jgi:2-polyprenyl-3-methyl-5-hydroxy-6-metoxy-1,4-benzoquinol methylase
MLKRTLEPELMDSEEDARQYNRMDHGAVNELFVDELLAFAHGSCPHESKNKATHDTENFAGAHQSQEPDPQATESTDNPLSLGDVLDLGTGTALIPVVLCRQDKRCRVMAVDLAVSMLELAVYNIEAAGVAERITLAQTDAKQLIFEDDMFDATVSNSIIHHIPDPLACVHEMLRVTRPGGILFVRDLRRPGDLETLTQLVQTYVGDESDYSQKLFEDSLHASLSLQEMRDLVAVLGFDPESVQPTSDRHWTWAARAPAKKSC